MEPLKTEVKMDTSGKALVELWDYASQKGLLNSNTATAFRVACTKVLGIDEGWEERDVLSLDVEDHLRRFEMLQAKNYTPDSLATYKSRFSKALELFKSRLENPSGWRPASRPSRETSNGAAAETDAPRRERRPRVAPAGHRAAAPRTGDHDGDGSLITYPFPLRDGCVITISLPADLRPDEAKRLNAFINALAVQQPSEV